VAGATSAAAPALADDTGDSVVDGDIHHVVTDGAIVCFAAAIGLHEGNAHGVLSCIHARIISLEAHRSRIPPATQIVLMFYRRGFIVVIGLTGGIASGKSTVAQQLGNLGAYVIDADKLGHSAYVKGSAAFDQVVSTFGADVVGEDGEVARRQLGGKVFGNPTALKQLTDIVWPAIRSMAEREIEDAINAQPHRPVVLEAAVLIEADWLDLADQVWVTVVAPNVAIDRACARDNLQPDAVQARLDAQLSNEARRAHADQVIDNSTDETGLRMRVENLWMTIA
jgi:phosphopantetheine adenylyltransferase/dephospho-CoA kinase